ncbi:hypothetical protein ACHHYP_09940 [Achlya hypogyna]|uniref:START domain-containing protein n=1 Tax=Achlya hypogyna TaxID=1202772 RepID=A0A1V9YM59_ACHHY|nr:hypothetical protein ACHHYP_09940 [Achlya hypogyna]
MQRKRKRNVHELQFLRTMQAKLEAEAVRLEARATGGDDGWEAVARRQAAASHEAQQENARLRRAVEGQLQLARALESLLTQPLTLAQPLEEMLTDVPLPVHVVARAARMHTLLDGAFDRLESAFVQRGIVDRTDMSFANVEVTEAPGAVVQLMSTRVATVPMAVASVADRVWTALTTDSVTGGVAIKRLETVDGDTIYYHFEVDHEGLSLLRCNYGLKRYVLPGTTSFVIRSMGFDPLHPPSPCAWFSDDVVLIRLCPSSDGGTIFKKVLTLRVPYSDDREAVDDSQYFTMSEMLLESFARTNHFMEELLGYNTSQH